MAEPTKRSLTQRLKAAVHRHSFFGKVEEVADRRRHAFNKKVREAANSVSHADHAYAQAVAALKRAEAADDGRNLDRLLRDSADAWQVLALARQRQAAMIRKREFWRDRYTWAHERHAHWGTVLRHRRDRLHRWVEQHEGFQPYMTNGDPHEALTDEAKRAIYLDFRDGLYVTSTYEGYPGDGVHADSSYHYLPNQPDGKARCWDAASARRGPMVKAQQRQAREFSSYLVEMFGPDNAFAYKNGIRFSLPEGSALETMHDNHKHTDLRDGAFA